MDKVKFFHLGPQKSATSWLYVCFQEHPEICAAKKDSVHYFDMLYQRDEEWFNGFFKHCEAGQTKIDMTPTYIRNTQAPARIKEYNSEAKVLLCLRDPIERAFSHYWHIKKKDRFDFKFTEALSSYDLFSSWVEPGLYVQHIECYLKNFDRKDILAQDFSLLKSDPEMFLKETLEFMEVDSTFQASVFGKRVNVAKSRQGKTTQKLFSIMSKIGLSKPLKNTWKKLDKIGLINRKGMEYLDDVPDAFIQELLDLYEPETQRLEQLLDIDLSHWRTAYKNRK